jgi:hypothetical protein
LNPRPASYKDAALTAELRASDRVRPEGFEPTPTWLKARDAAVTPRPRAGRAYAFQSTCLPHVLAPWFCCLPVVALRIELSATRISAGYGQPALDYRFHPVGKVGLEPTLSCSQNTRACRCPTSRNSQSERSDLNRGHRREALVAPGPQPGALTSLRHVLNVLQASKWAVRRSNPRLLVFR